MHMVSLITGQVQTRQDLFLNEGKIMDTLVSSGYRLHEADAALTLLQNLSQDSDESGAKEESLPLAGGMRAMSRAERSRFTVDAFSFVTKLAHLGILSVEQREDILGKALVLHIGRIGLDDVRSLLAASLFPNEEEQEESLAPGSDSGGIVWN